MGLIANLSGWFRGRIVSWLEGGNDPAFTERSMSIAGRRDYRLGIQRRYLRKSKDGYDDNVVGNFLGLALDRGISLLFGKEVEFEWNEDVAEDVVNFIDNIWEANNKPILLHKLAMYGGEDGTVFAKLVPDQDKLWRILPQDPMYKDIVTDPDDDSAVIRYITQYKTRDLENNEIAKKETITRSDFEGEGGGSPDTWTIKNYTSSDKTGGKWSLVSEEVWPYPLPPIVHWQNLPMVGNVWGMPDIPDDVIEVQDKSNFNLSNINKIVRLFAHPFRWARGFGGGGAISTGPDNMPNVDNMEAEIFQLPAAGDLPGAVQHSMNLRQIIFDVTRNMDITSMKDRVGQLTNFGLRVLFFDALNKLDTKRNLYGWGIREINRRLLMFSNMDYTLECTITWQDPLPQDEAALHQNVQLDLQMGLISKETAAGLLGYDWEDEQEKIANEQQGQVDIGTAILRSFDRTGGMGGGVTRNETPQPGQRQPLQLAR